MTCLPCVAQLHEECADAEIIDTFVEDGITYDAVRCCCGSAEELQSEVGNAIVIGGYKQNDDVRDATSTGRKRAAQLKPIIEGMVCEWANLGYAGGGAIPIVGCGGVTLTKEKGNRLQTGNIHHGPDKSTLNNTDENLHRVCGQCHNRWHTLNDPLYPKTRPANGAPFLPISGQYQRHDKHTLATDEHKKRDAEWWALPEKNRPDYTEYVRGMG